MVSFLVTGGSGGERGGEGARFFFFPNPNTIVGYMLKLGGEVVRSGIPCSVGLSGDARRSGRRPGRRYRGRRLNGSSDTGGSGGTTREWGDRNLALG